MPGAWNAHLGWLLLLAGFAAAVGLDPWSLSERDPALLLGSARMAARHAQAVVLAMGLLQLAAALLLRENAIPAQLRRFVSLTLIAGTLVYGAAYTGIALGVHLAWVIPAGAAINLAGFALLGRAAWRVSVAAEVRVVVSIFALGMALDVATGLYAADNWHFLGAEDDVRQRMLRLARVAATALSLLTLLARDRISADGSAGNRAERLALLVGTVGMPSVLAAASFVAVDIKYFLPIPALAMTGAVLLVLARARRTAAPLEQWGWLWVAVSMNIGLLVGSYAFDGPLPTPAFVGDYNAFVRRLSRLGHAYAIVLGLLAILLARRQAGRLAAVLLIAGSVVTEAGIAGLALAPEATVLVVPGPVLIVLALAAVLVGPREERDRTSAKEPEEETTSLSRQRNGT